MLHRHRRAIDQRAGGACAREKWDEAGRLAQDIVGAAGGLGLTAITQAARDFAQAAREGQNRHELRNAAQMVVGEHVRARSADPSISRSASSITPIRRTRVGELQISRCDSVPLSERRREGERSFELPVAPRMSSADPIKLALEVEAARFIIPRPCPLLSTI